MECKGSAPLTLSNLNLPQFQEQVTGRAELFVRSQRAYTSAFTAEGGAVPHGSETLNMNSTVDLKRNYTESNDTLRVGFSSPVLKPRADRTQRSVELTEHRDTFGNSKLEARGVNTHPTVWPPENPLHRTHDATRKLTIQSRTAKRRGSPVGEHAARLSERRDRKRAKRAIVEPALVQLALEDDASDDDEEGKKKRKKKKGTTKTRRKVESGLALMQSFSATNVGKERLTLKSGPRMGFFNKGKASVLTKTYVKKRKGKDFTFSEFKFLNNTRPELVQTQSHSSSSTFSTSNAGKTLRSGLSKFFTTDPPGRPVRNTERRLQFRRNETSHLLKMADFQKRERSVSSDNDRRSEVWDIELDDAVPSDHSCSGGKGKGSTVVLGTSARRWEDVRHTRSLAKDPEEPQTLGSDHSPAPDRSTVQLQPNRLQRGTHSSSLAPSNSASHRDADENEAPLDAIPEPVRPARRQGSVSRTGDKTPPLFRPSSFRFPPEIHLDSQTYPLMLPSSETQPASLFVEDGSDRDHAWQCEQSILYDAGYSEGITPQVLDCPLQSHGVVERGCPMAYWADYKVSQGPQWQHEDIGEDLDPNYSDLEVHALENQYYDGGYEDGLGSLMEECDEGLDVLSQGWGVGHLYGSDAWMESDGQLLAEATMVNATDANSEWSEPELGTVSPTISPSNSPRFSFAQGRSLLFGMEKPTLHDIHRHSSVEAGNTHHEVARNLKDHWLPQNL